MFITQSQHNRNAVGVSRGWKNVDDEGLGIVVTQSTRFDPTRMAQREAYWYNVIVQDMASQYRGAGYVDGLSGLGQGGISPLPLDTIINPMSLVMKPLEKIPVVGKFTAPLNMVFDVFTLGLTKILPKIPIIGGIFTSIFGGGGPPKIPWNEIYGIARSQAHQIAIDEENARIVQEGYETQVQRQTAVEKISQEGALFKLPEHVIGIKRGAMTMVLKGQPVEKKVG